MNNMIIGYIADDQSFTPQWRTTAIDGGEQELAIRYCQLRNQLSIHQWCLKPYGAGEYNQVEHLTYDELCAEFDEVCNSPSEYDEYSFIS